MEVMNGNFFSENSTAKEIPFRNCKTFNFEFDLGKIWILFSSSVSYEIMDYTLWKKKKIIETSTLEESLLIIDKKGIVCRLQKVSWQKVFFPCPILLLLPRLLLIFFKINYEYTIIRYAPENVVINELSRTLVISFEVKRRGAV